MFFFFFFQAEDGIRDHCVTGVQTCALPIYIDDTFCAAYGGQQLAFWNAHHDERGFASMHIYHVASGTPVAAILRPACTPRGTEVRTVIKHVTQRLRRHWRRTRIVWRGDGHYGPSRSEERRVGKECRS